MNLGELPAEGLADIEGAGTTNLIDLHREGVPGSTLVEGWLQPSSRACPPGLSGHGQIHHPQESPGRSA
jgi:hypothetical protein